MRQHCCLWFLLRHAALLFGLGCGLGAVPAAAVVLPALDAGFVTEAGGSSKGDATLAPGAKHNYSAGFELHYGTGALGAPLAPMFRKNYFVFDLSAVGTPIAAAKLTLWAGTLESADPSEAFAIKESTDMPGVLGLAAALAGGSTVGEFDSPGDPLVMAAATLFDLLGDGPLFLGGLAVTHTMDDSFVDIVFSPAGVAHLGAFVGGEVLLAGVVPSALPPAFPQQPFGFTGPDIPGGDPKTPLLVLTLVPEPPPALQLLAGVALGAGLRAWRRRATRQLHR